AAVQYSWNLPALADRLELTEKELREALFKYTKNEELLDKEIRTFLPQVGGLTCYFFGDIRKLRSKTCEVAVRVHDECNGSDVFGTDICTCRPYLVFALQSCIECAQRGGVGLVVYFRKEGRSLGEVTKFRVYNARKNQVGGDSAEKYFYQTESIAGIRDARFQAMMPDVLNWLGIERIDWLLSMSNEKYEAIINAGIRVDQRVPLPNMYVPKHAFVEITAKGDELMEELRDLRTIRKQCYRIYDLAKQDKLNFFSVRFDKIEDCAKDVVTCIKKHYPDLNVPMHSRFRHLDAKVIENLRSQWTSSGVRLELGIVLYSPSFFFSPSLSLPSYMCTDDNYMYIVLHSFVFFLLFACIDYREQSRRLIDLTFVSVLLDAGAGENWKYVDRYGHTFNRSEGIGAASLQMFLDGMFSSDEAMKTRVNSRGLHKLSAQELEAGFQVSKSNPMVGLEGRAGLLKRLAKALEKFPQYFGYEGHIPHQNLQKKKNIIFYNNIKVHRPGHLLDYLLKKADKNKKVSLRVLWHALVVGLEPIWPQRITGIRSGDVWAHNQLRSIGKPGSDMVPFHKLVQWLCYSIVEEFTRYGIQFEVLDDLTCLAEYRNGGLLIDTGVIVPKEDTVDLEMTYHVGSEIIVEWRALTVALIDQVADYVRKYIGKTKTEFPLAKVLEGGTWRAGRELAFKLRPSGNSPIKIRSDGTVF
ncbi:hypothetical protein RFI_27134, partial [Reticulomyxa filosa]